VRKSLGKFALTASIMLALALTFSCHDNGNDDDDETTTGSKGSSSSVKGGGDSSPAKNSSSSGTGGSSPSKNSSSSGANLAGDKGTFKDSRDGQTYKWVKIDTQIWMAQNLNYSEELLGKCYDNKDSNCEKYGRLYEWDDALRVCPDGWHLPSTSEWNTLVSAVGKDPGKSLKSTSSDWRDGGGTDSYDFGALPGGGLESEFKNINIRGDWWTSTENSGAASTYATTRYMNSANTVQSNNPSKLNQYSVRCIEGYSSSSSIVYGEITDKRDNKKYKTVKIGTQNWMAQNLNYSEKGVCYNNKDANCDIYGRLYDWVTAMDISADYNNKKYDMQGQQQGICPDGWHLPTNSEWNALVSAVGGYPARKLKARNDLWGKDYGTDIYGFGALPGGGSEGEFKNLNTLGSWWTTTENSNPYSYVRTMNSGNTVPSSSPNKKSLYSVRCVED